MLYHFSLRWPPHCRVDSDSLRTIAECICTAILASSLIVPTISRSADQQDVTTHGTLISAFGNANGLVVVTDSMATFRDPTGKPQHRSPAQKLLKYNDRTVCAIAGLGSAVIPAAPNLNADILGIVAVYRDQMHAKGIDQPIARALVGISALLRFYLENIATINAETGHATEPSSYYLELLLVGYDLDGIPKIGELVIRVEARQERGGQMGWQAHELQNDVLMVGQELRYSVKGINYIATRDLESPELVDGYSIFRTYADGKKLNAGASLTVDQIEELQRALVDLTADVHREVGGPKQVAVLQLGHIARLDQPNFSDPKTPFPLIIFKNDSFGRGGIIIRGNIVRFYDSSQFNGEPMTFDRPPTFLVLDGSIFVNCTFKNQNLQYNGGNLYLDKTNLNLNSHITFGTEASKRPDIVKLLAEMFPPS